MIPTAYYEIRGGTNEGEPQNVVLVIKCPTAESKAVESFIKRDEQMARDAGTLKAILYDSLPWLTTRMLVNMMADDYAELRAVLDRGEDDA